MLKAGAPNIMGTASSFRFTSSCGGSGALKAYKSAGLGSEGSGSWGYGYIDLDASRSNSVYGAAETIQPPALQKISQVKF